MNGTTRKPPLGVDIGTASVRIALREATRDGSRIAAVAARDLPAGVSVDGDIHEPDLVIAMIREMASELGVRRGRAVCAVGPPAATMRTTTFPRMSARDRGRAARLELYRRLGQASESVVARVHAIERGSDLYEVGAVSARVLGARATTLRKAGMRVCAVDYEGRALTRCFPNSDAVLDVGHDRTSLHVTSARSCLTWWAAVGGNTITEGIGRDLGIDTTAAEARKRALGTAGAGEAARVHVVREVGELISKARKERPIGRITVVGNGSRVSGLLTAIETTNGVLCRRAAPDEIGLEGYPPDIVSPACADWALALALAT